MSRNHPHLYEISTVPWLFELSNASGRTVHLGEVPASEWDRLKELGFDYVWLMGVWRKSLAGRQIFRESTELYPVYSGALPGWTPEDVIGSPYSIQAYEPDPQVGGWQELDSARRELDRRGMGLILDFVPNHVGPDHAWVRSNPERFVQGSDEIFASAPSAFFQVETESGQVANIAKGRDPYFDPWKDTVQLNYFHPSARRAMVDTLKTISEHADGVRCDMAMLVLNDIFSRTWGRLLTLPAPEQEFWEEARAELPGMVWIAEAYWDTEFRLQQLGFDFVYDKRLYDRLRHSSPQDIRAHLTAGLDYQRRLVRFIENHDEPRSAAVFPDGRLRAAAATFATLPGLRFYNQGQMEGKTIHLPVQLRQARAEEPDSPLRAFYERLLETTGHPCFHDGAWSLLDAQPIYDDSSRNLVVYGWKLEDDFRLVAVNFADSHSQASVVLKGWVRGDRSFRVRDAISGQTWERDGAAMTSQGLHVVLAGQQAQILSFE